MRMRVIEKVTLVQRSHFWCFATAYLNRWLQRFCAILTCLLRSLHGRDDGETNMTWRIFQRHAGAFAAALVATWVSTVPGTAASPSVEAACANDYYAYCSRHDPDGKAVRSCMRSNGSRLSQACVNALTAAGEIPKATRRASRR
jgi:hypothetical protein